MQSNYIFCRRHWGAGHFRRVRYPCSETQCEGSPHAETGEHFFIPIADGTVPVHSLGVRSESRFPDEKPLLGPAEQSLYRTIVGKLMFIVAERPDIQYCVKECARGVQSPGHAEGKAHLQMSHGHSRLDIEAGTLEGCRHVTNDGRQ